MVADDILLDWCSPRKFDTIYTEEQLTTFLQETHREVRTYVYKGIPITTGLFNIIENEIVAPYYCIDVGKAKVTLFCNGELESVKDTIKVINALASITVTGEK